jgi:hypothetical protein
MTIFRFNVKNFFILIVLIVFPFNMNAANVGYAAGLAFGKYGNINLVSQPTEGEYSQITRAGLTIFEDTSNLLVNFNADIRYIDYKKNLSTDETRGNILGNVLWRIRPGRFEWAVDNKFTQSIVNPLGANTPRNRQNINVFSTGPNFNIRINPSNNLVLEARAQRYSYEVNPDNDRLSTAIRWLHNLNSAIIISLNNEGQITEFDVDSANSDFEQNDTFLGVNYERGPNILVMEYGKTSIKDKDIDDQGRYLFSFTNARTRTSTLQFAYTHRLTDTGSQVLQINPIEGTDGTPLNGVGNDIYVNEMYRMRYKKTFIGGDFGVDIFSNSLRYQRFSTLDEDSQGAAANVIWYLPRGNTIKFNLRRRDVEFKDPTVSREYNDTTLQAEYKYILQRNVDIRFMMVSLDRSSTIDGRSYDDLRYFVSLNYTSL